MERIKCVISYDGSEFSGYQVQPNGRTVQEEIERALQKMTKGSPIRVTASGRTDAGVHAKGQVIHFDTELQIPEDKWKKAMNTLLPQDIRILEVRKVSSSFHARFDVQQKTYKYFIDLNKDMDIFNRKYTYHFPFELDVESIEQACELLVGEHDFTAFCAANSGVKGEKVRTIYYASGTKLENQLVFTFTGSGFLYNMVRILVGTLLEIGTGKRNATDILGIIESKDRKKAGKTAPAHGLYLWEVMYEEKR
ncbi:tRNA pseudouridine(38-40) synthase TruA [Radiobacillus kanasensis]|uniref:tRNA pseudouridine(38-40) synthase TruA n=1 Tax=Radiobacillus kanasensis TaxID=2844358 RepID=UPI001E5642D7|nr:tRNA pseudouridine(38-40) synthase TruA [Radiobacillus kanasensis]UFT99527.1 tRNA pseudouridine(38-40) synthase TruA [Radiobacillus kanasensis]